MANITRFDGSLGSPKGKTSFGHFDGDPDFLTDAPKTGDWIAKKLGWPSVDIEISEDDLYNAFEEAVLEFSSIVNDANIQNNLSVLKGSNASQNLSGRHISGSPVRETVRLAKSYGSQIGHGGNVNYHKTYIELVPGEQKYDIEALIAARREDKEIEPIAINNIYHYGPLAQSRMYSPFSGTGVGMTNTMSSFGWSDMGVGVGASHFVQPVYYDLMKMQAVEFNDQIRRSQYSYKLQNNKLTIFPVPKKPGRLWLEFAYEKELSNESIISADPNSESVVSDYSNVPYDVIPYENINAPSRRWIMKFALAAAKNKLGQVRSKFDSTPSPGDSFRIDGSDLKQEAQQEKQELRQQLRERLQNLSRSEQMDRQQREADALQSNLEKIPLPIFTG